MSIELYGKALVDKIKAVFENTVYASVDEAFKEAARVNGTDDKVKLPLISVYRTEIQPVPEFFSHFGLHHGREVRKDGSISRSVIIKTLPLRLGFQVDVWAASGQVCDTLFEELLFYLSLNPRVEVSFEAAGTTQSFTYTIEAFTDNTEPSGFGERGRLYRMTMDVVFDNVQLAQVVTEPYAIQVPIEYYDFDGKPVI